MRGGRSQPKEVSRSTYHAHAHLRVASYDDFVSQQTHLQPNLPNHPEISNTQQGLGSGHGNRTRSLSPTPTTSHANKRRRHDLSEDNEGIEVQGDESTSNDAHEAGLGENTHPDDTHASVSILNQQLRHIFLPIQYENNSNSPTKKKESLSLI